MQTGQQLKEQGQQLALLNAGTWSEQAIDLLEQFTQQRGSLPFLFEDFRAWAHGMGLQQPVSHKVWGALAGDASRRGLIAWTGSYKATTSPKTHGHPAKEWRAA